MSNTHGLSFVNSENSATQAFSVQYITLMLIIITFFVGAILRPSLASAPQKEPPKKVSIPAITKPAPARDVFLLNNFYEGAEGQLSVGLAMGLAEVLTRHDRDADIEILAPDPSPREFSIALERAESLYQFLLRQHVPEEAMTVAVVPRFSDQAEFDPTAIRVVLRPISPAEQGGTHEGVP